MAERSRPAGQGYKISVVSTNQDAWLVDRIRQRDLRVFEAFYEESRPKLGGFLARLVNNQPQIVEEVFNDTMMTVWEKANDFTGESKFSTWVYAIAYRKAIKARSKAAKYQQREDQTSKNVDENFDAYEDPEIDLGNNSLKTVLLRALEDLSPDHRTVIDLAYFQEMHYREIAAVMDCPVDTVKTRMFHARRKLKSVLGGNVADWV